MTAQLPSGGAERMNISPHKNLKTARTDMHAKKVKDVLTQLYPRIPSSRSAGMVWWRDTGR